VAELRQSNTELTKKRDEAAATCAEEKQARERAHELAPLAELLDVALVQITGAQKKKKEKYKSCRGLSKDYAIECKACRQ
jgi:hypothetical protein